MHRIRKTLLIGVLFTISNVIWWRIDDKVSSQLSNNNNNANITYVQKTTIYPQQQREQYKVFEFHPGIALLQNSTSATLISTSNDEERHGASMIWSTKSNVIEEVLKLAIESMWIRLQRNGKVSSKNHNNRPNINEMKSQLQQFTQDELNVIDPQWQIFLLDNSDGGMGIWPYWFMQHEMAPLLGWKRINYATRSTQNDRYMDVCVQKNSLLPNSTYDEYVGKTINFTAMIADGADGKNNTILGTGCRSIQRLMMNVREPIVDAIDEYMKNNHPAAYQEAVHNANNGDIEEARLYLSKAIAHLERPIDVRTFWNASVCNMFCSFRNHISEIVQTLPQRHPRANIQANIEVVGFIHGQGRQQVHPDFIRGMMTTKIIVLAQRDRWEGHSRLYETLLSGALVMSDPQIYFPHGIIDKKNIVIYNSWVELETMILHYLNNDEERIQIGRRGRELALSQLRSWQQAERLFLNDMEYRNEYGISNKPWQ